MTTSDGYVNGHEHHRGNGKAHRGEANLIDVGAERSLVGGGLLDPTLIPRSGVVRADFYSDQLGLIWEAMFRMHADGKPIDTATVSAYLADRGQLERVGGVSTLLQLTDTIPAVGEHYAQRVRLLAAKRNVELAAKRILTDLADPENSPRAFVRFEEARRALAVIESGGISEVVWRGDLFEPLPPPRFVVPGLHLGPGRPALWAGYGWSAKTLSAQALGLAVASGTPVWGHFETVAGAVRHLDYEQGFYATARRYQRLAIGHGIDPMRVKGRLNVAVFPPVFLDSPNAVDAYARECEGAALVILDALRGATPGVDENDSRIRACLDNLSRVSEKTGSAFVVLHHAGKPKDTHIDGRTVPRGSSAIFDACGCVFVVAAGATPDAPRKVSQQKSPAEAEGGKIDDFGLRVEDVEELGNPTAGVRVAWEPIVGVDPVKQHRESSEADKQRLLAAVRERPGSSQRKVIELAGMNPARAANLLKILEEDGLVRTAPGKQRASLYYIAGVSDG